MLRILLTAISFCLIIFNAVCQVAPSIDNLHLLSVVNNNSLRKANSAKLQTDTSSYDLTYHRFELYVNPAKDTIAGSVTSYFLQTSRNTRIQFVLTAGMHADSAIFHSKKADIGHVGNILTISFGKSMPTGSFDSVTVYYHGNPASTGFGSFGVGKHAGKPAMWTLSEPFGASDWWPSKNDLTDKIDSIDMYVITPKGNHVASNGLLIIETAYDTNNVIAHWKHRYPIASYLIAIASTNYARYSNYFVKNGKTLEVLNYVYPEDSASIGAATPATIPSLNLYDSIFGTYPFVNEKYGHAQFGWGGGMEHQTMTFMGRGAFNHEIIAHELAHQWFGDMVTCGSWHDIWLNESFATFCAGLTYEHLFDRYYWPIWKSNNLSFVCGSPAGSVYCADTTSVGRIFDSRLSYSKGALVLNMLRWVVGDEAFFAGVRNYLNDPDLKYGFAYTGDFKKHIENVYGKNLDGFFNDWIYGQGYPSYSAVAGQTDIHTAWLTLLQKQSDPSVNFFELPVEVHFFGSDADTAIVFDNTYSGQTFNFDPGFQIDSVAVDPDQWLISWNNKVTIASSESHNENVTKIFPNPAHNLLQLYTTKNARQFEIYAADGKWIKTISADRNSKRYEWDVSDLKNGIYLLKILGDEFSASMRFAVVR